MIDDKREEYLFMIISLNVMIFFDFLCLATSKIAFDQCLNFDDLFYKFRKDSGHLLGDNRLKECFFLKLTLDEDSFVEERMIIVGIRVIMV